MCIDISFLNHLILRLCTSGTPVKDTLDAWPALPLFECQVSKPSSQLEEISAAMEDSEPFLELIHLQLGARCRLEIMEVVPDSFLTGSALLLRTFWLDRIRFLGLTTLFLSTTHLIDPRHYVTSTAEYIPSIPSWQRNPTSASIDTL